MVYDLIGLRPLNERGKHFVNNIFMWPILADFILAFCRDCMEVNELNADGAWYCNDGHKVSKHSAKRIALKLKQILADPKRQEKFGPWLMSYHNNPHLRNPTIVTMAHLSQRPAKDLFTWDNVEEFVEFCENSGGFTIL